MSSPDALIPPAPTDHPVDIEVADVARSFGEVHAVRSVSFHARAGEVTGLVGPNGSGKTTLLLMLATLLVPDHGTISIGGHDPVTESAAVRRMLGWMPDVLGAWPNLTVRRSLELAARLYDLPRPAAAARAGELIELVDLVELADQPTRVLSRGQKQRLSLARALVHDPRVLLLDEPASGLDPGARIALRVLLRRLAAEGRTVLVSSHVLAELDELADRAVFLDAGMSVSAARVEAAQRAARGWRIRSLDAQGLHRALVASGIDADRIQTEPQGLVVPLTGEEHAAQLLAQLVRGGIPIVSFAPAVGDLEHTFLDLSAGGDPGGGPGGDPAERDPSSDAEEAR